MPETNLFLHACPVQDVDGAPAVVFTSGGDRIVLRGSASIGYLAGWSAAFLYTGFAPILVFQLVHAGGERIVWYASSNGDRLSDDVSRLSDHHRALLRHAAAPVVGSLVRVLAQAPAPVLDDAMRGYLALDDQCRRQVLHLCEHAWQRPIEKIRLQDAAAPILVNPGDGAAPVFLQPEHVVAALRRNLQDQLVRDVARHALHFLCPATGAEITSQGSLCFDDFHFAYRFTDVGGRVVFYAIAGSELSAVYALYVPCAGLLFYVDHFEGHAEGARRFLPNWTADHFMKHGAAFASYLARPLTGISSPLRAPPWTHIGHQLWNELSGIEQFLELAGPSGTLPEWIVPDREREIEFYGPIDTLFPRLRGLVRRGLGNAEDLIRYAYAEGRVIVRVTREHVSARMRRRLLDHARDATLATEQIRRLDRRAGTPLLLLGLRLENRTLVDLAGFYERLVGSVLTRHPSARFVIDGYNVSSEGHGKYQSHGEKIHEALATEAAERALLLRLRDRHGGDVIIDAIGLSVPQNLLLVERCDAFVAPWGAGLAKYRWACNKPGYVFSSRWNLERRADLHIYDLPDLLEAPTDLRWISPDLVSDQPEAPRLVGIYPHPQWFNFTMDEDAATRDVLRMLDDLDAARTG